MSRQGNLNVPPPCHYNHIVLYCKLAGIFKTHQLTTLTCRQQQSETHSEARHTTEIWTDSVALYLNERIQHELDAL